MVASADDITPIDRALTRLLKAGNDSGAASALRSLFVEELDFHVANGLVVLRRPEPAKAALRIASRDGVQVVLARMSYAGPLRVGDIRSTLLELKAPLGGDILLVAGNPDGDEWQLVYPTYRGGREVLRRMVLHRGHGHRTVVEQLAKVWGEAERGDLRAALERAYDVEVVTRAFFREYKRVFDRVMALVEGFTDAEDHRLFCQTLFNRLMFIYFLQRKRWLAFRGDTAYLHAIWRDSSRQGESFYEVRLKLLFFMGLNNPRTADFDRARVLARDQIGEVPFLNGGLFEETQLDRQPGIKVPNAAIDLILNDLFGRFNFTITESTPYDVEVAVDPEMLGKVFEELVTGRHETGSYYTPRPIVSFMCREALKGYLAWRVPSLGEQAISQYVDHQDVSGIDRQQAGKILDALDEITVVDPACGSGAYLLGMMQELLGCENLLYNPQLIDTSRSQYDMKLRIIKRNVYGVDIDRFGVNIAMLRLWLSLIVDYEGPGDPPALPNLDFKIACGDSLLGPNPDPYQPTLLQASLAQEIAELKAQYLEARGEDKNNLHREIESRTEALQRETEGGGLPAGTVDWRVQFAEVFQRGGFDVVAANPPYVRQELIKDQKPQLKLAFDTHFTATADLFVYFYFRAVQLLRPGGMLVFISSNKWFRAAYGEKLRDYIAAATSVRSITDFGDLPVFESATAYPMIFAAQKGGPPVPTRYTRVESLLPPYPDMAAIVGAHGRELAIDALRGSAWNLSDSATSALMRTMSAGTVPLNVYVNGQIYYGIKTGLNEAFYVTTAQRAALIEADPRSTEIIKPLLVGKDIKRWLPTYWDRWLIFTRCGIDIDNYPAIEAHLTQWRDRLTPKTAGTKKDDPGRKPGRYKWYEIQDDVAYYRIFDQPKLIYPVISKNPSFAYDDLGCYSNDKTFLIGGGDMYLLGVLNSPPAWTWLQNTCSSVRGGFLELRSIYLEHLPIPDAGKGDRQKVAALVEECLGQARAGRAGRDHEADIGERVAWLYGLKNPASELPASVDDVS